MCFARPARARAAVERPFLPMPKKETHDPEFDIRFFESVLRRSPGYAAVVEILDEMAGGAERRADIVLEFTVGLGDEEPAADVRAWSRSARAVVLRGRRRGEGECGHRRREQCNTHRKPR